MSNQESMRQAEIRLAGRVKERARNIKEIDSLFRGGGFDWTKVESPSRLAQRAKRLGLFEEAGALLKDPTDKAMGNRVFERILGANNLLGVTFLTEGVRKSKAIARIKIPMGGGNRLGTGFMVSPRVMLTNNHVLADEIEAGNATLEFDYYKREDGTIGPVARFSLLPGDLFITDVGLDYTLVAVEASGSDDTSVSERGWIPLIGPSGKAVVGERVSIIQHPNGDPQKVCVHDNKLVDVDPNSAFLHYETDTMGGSSGSPVMNIHWDLVALHHAAVGQANEGVRISSIVFDVRAKLQQESTGSITMIGRGLVQELLASKSPPAGSSSSEQSGGATGDVIPGNMPSGSPQFNSDGTATWTIPVSLTLGVGQNGAGPILNHAATLGEKDLTQTKNGPLAKKTVQDDPALQQAIEALESTHGRVYYSEVKDNEAIAAYYPSLEGLSKDQRYDVLSELLGRTHTRTLSYKDARLNHLYPWIDRREDSNRQLRGIYSNKTFDALEVIRQEAAMERRRERALQERYAQESFEPVDEEFLESLEAAHPYNCEHVVPQSWFNKRRQPKADLHHLFTCEWGCNSFRGNHAYFDFSEEAFRENCGERENGKFDPKHGKGAVARATLYFLLRYPGDIADSNKEMPKERVKTLVDWAKNDKIDRWEKHRNAEIQKLQGNRNPLIDFPDLVTKIAFERGFA